MAGGGTPESLNLIPFLDVVTTLIITMIVISTFETVALREAAVEAPGYGPIDGKPRPTLDVLISAEGFIVRRDGGSVGLRADEDGMPYADLTAAMRTVHDSGGASLRATVSADPQVPYRTVVKTLDALRGDAAGPLYPSVVLAAAVTTVR